MRDRMIRRAQNDSTPVGCQGTPCLPQNFIFSRRACIGALLNKAPARGTEGHPPSRLSVIARIGLPLLIPTTPFARPCPVIFERFAVLHNARARAAATSSRMVLLFLHLLQSWSRCQTDRLQSGHSYQMIQKMLVVPGLCGNVRLWPGEARGCTRRSTVIGRTAPPPGGSRTSSFRMFTTST